MQLFCSMNYFKRNSTEEFKIVINTGCDTCHNRKTNSIKILNLFYYFHILDCLKFSNKLHQKQTLHEKPEECVYLTEKYVFCVIYSNNSTTILEHWRSSIYFIPYTFLLVGSSTNQCNFFRVGILIKSWGYVYQILKSYYLNR